MSSNFRRILPFQVNLTDKNTCLKNCWSNQKWLAKQIPQPFSMTRKTHRFFEEKQYILNPGKNREKKTWRQKWPANDRCSGTEPTKGSLVALIYLDMYSKSWELPLFHLHPTFQVTLLFQESCVVLLDVMCIYLYIHCIYYLFFKRNTSLSPKKIWLASLTTAWQAW